MPSPEEITRINLMAAQTFALLIIAFAAVLFVFFRTDKPTKPSKR